MWKTSDFVVDTNNLSLVSSLRLPLAARNTEDLWTLETGDWRLENVCLSQTGRLVILLCSDLEQHISGFFTAVKQDHCESQTSLYRYILIIITPKPLR